MPAIRPSVTLILAARAALAALAAATFVAGCTLPPVKPATVAARPTPATAPAGAATTLSSDQILTVDQLRPGMTGYGLTVFAGARPERFGVEVISVLRNYDPKTDMILIRCSGHDLEKTGIAAGMSGSPIYINGKLIGALAFGWRFTIQPIAGVQPIEQMLRNSGMRVPLPPATQEDIPAGEPAARSQGVVASVPLEGLFADGTNGANGSRGSELRGDPTRLEPLSTPLMVSGGSKAAMDRLRRDLAGTGLVPLKSGGAAGDDPRMADARIEPGGTLAIPIVSGDMDAAAIGTVTAVIGDRVLAFGHPMFGEGPVNLPMATGIIHTFIPSIQSSFKMGSAGPVVGAIRRDESTAILGVPGQIPSMAPMTVRVSSWDGSPTRAYHFQLVDDWYFSPLAAVFALMGSATADHGQPVDLTVYYSGQVKFRSFPPFKFDGVGIGAAGLDAMAMSVGLPIKAMLTNPWGKAQIESIEVDLRTVNERSLAELEHARLETATLAPAEPAVIHLTLRPYKKPRIDRTIKVDLPADLPDGSYLLSLLDGPSYRMLMRMHNPRQFMPENMTELMAAMNRLAGPREDQLYVVLTLPAGGISTRDQTLPSLPPSRVAILQQSNRYEMLNYTEDQVWPQSMGMVVTGSERFQITIDRFKGKHR